MTTSAYAFSLPALPPLAPEDFARATRLLQDKAGILLGAHKRDMAERQLSLQASALGMATVTDYLDFLVTRGDDRVWQVFINAFTINHTAFFREPHHFRILAEFAQGRARPFSVWSASCSSGEEVWSIAMVLRETLARSDCQLTVVGSDIDTEVIETARKGIYTIDRVRTLSDERRREHFHRGVGARAGMVRIKDSLRPMVSYRCLNLLSSNWGHDVRYDAIFCRNTLIYFDKDTQVRLLERFASALKPDGLLFAGHSENLTYLTSTFELLGQTVYRLRPARMGRVASTMMDGAA